MTDKIYGYESITKVTGEIKDDSFNPMIYKSKTKSSKQDRFENIIYISCNLDTYIRDIKKLTNYKIEKLSIFDQFVDTEHLEIVSILKKINLVT